MTPAIALTDEQRARIADALVRCKVAPRALSEEAARIARVVVCRPALAEVRGPRSLVAHGALATRAHGIALGRRVFVLRDLVDAEGRAPLDLVAHEITHVAQYLRDGTIPFLLRYGRDYLAGRARGLDDRRAYLAIPYEVEARAVAASVGGADVRVLR
jgi:hypothetical protein